jgi:membrane peptidoglycan carboxypeptidase
MSSVSERRPLPRSKEEWRARLRDALDFGDPVRPPLPGGAELVHRVVLLAIVAALTGLLVAMLATPGIAFIGSTVRSLANRFSAPISEQAVPSIARRSVILDRKGRIIATLGEENREYVKLARVPKIAQQAVIATEDAKFYQHNGVDLAGLLRALIFNFRSGGASQGGSTITQQLVKKGIIEADLKKLAPKTLDRKIEEARLAVRLEQVYTKQQILEMYLNETYFGNGNYGIGTAAKFYFDEPVEKLTLPQAATLAGIINAPEDQDPVRHRKQAFERRNVSLQRMADVGFIPQATADKWKKSSLRAGAHPLPSQKESQHFVDYIRESVKNDAALGATPAERESKLLTGGLRIETTLDLDMQKAASEAVAAQIKTLKSKDLPLGALVSIEPSTGEVRAIIGNGTYKGKDYELARQLPGREPGSTFKTMTLVAALDNGFAPTLTFDTPSPMTLTGEDGKPWIVNNFEKKGEGLIELRAATAHSVNTYYAQLIQRVGPDKVVAEAHKLGIASDLPAVDALTLGARAVTPFELTNAYATLANGGKRCAPYFISKIVDAAGKTVETSTPDCVPAVSGNVAAAATDVLRDVVTSGTAAANGNIGRPAAGKTGTTDNHADAWFAGYTPQLATVVWVGYPADESRSLIFPDYPNGMTGGTLPTKIWARYMKAAHRGLPVRGFPAPPSFPYVTVPRVIGQKLDAARAALDAAGFPTTQIVYEKSRAPEGTVLAQVPAGNRSVPGGEAITLTVSGTPAPAPSPSATPSPSASPSPARSPSPSPTASPSRSKKKK